MRAQALRWRFRVFHFALTKRAALLVAMFALVFARGLVAAETAESDVVSPLASDEGSGEFEPDTAGPIHFKNEASNSPVDATEAAEPIVFENDASNLPVDEAAYEPEHSNAEQVDYQNPFADDSANTDKNSPAAPVVGKDPCEAAVFKPLGELGISIAQPAGQLPRDQATPCWDEINQTAGPTAAGRYWPVLHYQWDATSLCHRPLYFEEINLERYGYGCCEPLQPAVSAAHFFLTVPVLPYCIANECPGECVYTLGHYRPGSCVPWQCHYPPWDPLAAIAEGGVWTGMVFLIP